MDLQQIIKKIKELKDKLKNLDIRNMVEPGGVLTSVSDRKKEIQRQLEELENERINANTKLE